MKYLSTFSGIEAATAAWHPLGWEPVGFSEIEPFPCAVLAHHYPNVPNYGDITKFRTWAVEPFRLLVGGSPCQSFSVAGLRKGLADERGNLMLEFGRLAEHYRPTWVVWENVPGVLSSNGGRDFASFLGMLAEFGYGFAYRVLDAQYFGVAQRRRRVFVVAHLGDWRPAAAALFEPHSLSGHPAPSRKAGKGTAKDAEGGVGGGSWWDGGQIAATLTKQNAGGNQRMPDKDNFGAVCVPHAFKMRGGCEGGGKGYLGQDECAFTISTGQDQQIAQPIPLNTMTMQGRPSDDANPRMGSGIGEPGDPCPTLTKGHSHAVVQPIGFDSYNQCLTGNVSISISSAASDINHVSGVLHHMAVRRLSPRECERLQGFPDDFTNIPWRGKPDSPDGPRYKALGNSMAVPVMRWIGERIQAVEELMNEMK